MPVMMILMRSRLTRLLVVTAMAFAMVTAAFAHRAPGGDEAALQSFILAGGNLNDFCGDGHLGPGGGCPLCRIADDALPPGPPGALPQIMGPGLALHPRLDSDLRIAGPARLTPEARGPPFG